MSTMGPGDGRAGGTDGYGMPGTRPLGTLDTSGVQVRLGRLEALEERREKRRKGLLAAGAASVLVVAAAVTAAMLLIPGSDGKEGNSASSGAPDAAPKAVIPKTGTPVEVSTADGTRYRIAAVAGGSDQGDRGAVAPQQSSAQTGPAYAYVEYVLSNPSDKKALLNFPGDIFINRDAVAVQERGRCLPQTGVTDDLCTGPVRNEIVRKLSGDALIPGSHGDRFLAPKSSYLVRATSELAVVRSPQSGELGLYIWKRLYMADEPAKLAPFPS
ncbi:hypothetical protein [Spirillospora sp. CA-294931]|uniref:hypothetical protein n=1 Tax=Spirillospora sp. CA-294931 TaxID=3240042 RepID=UPI003D918776